MTNPRNLLFFREINFSRKFSWKWFHEKNPKKLISNFICLISAYKYPPSLIYYSNFLTFKKQAFFLTGFRKKVNFSKVLKKFFIILYWHFCVFFLKSTTFESWKKNLCHHFNHPCLDNKHLYIFVHIPNTTFPQLPPSSMPLPTHNRV